MSANSKDIFDKIMTLPLLKLLNPFFQKRKSVILYIFFGALTTGVSIGLFQFCNNVLNINELISNIFSWIGAVSFAYITNRIWVFNSMVDGKDILNEIIVFYGGRLTTLFIEESLLLVFVTILNFNGLIIKTTAQVIVLISNYFISKIFVFKKKV